MDTPQKEACFNNGNRSNKVYVNRNILIVDDDNDIIDCFKYIFECEGFKIEGVQSPEEALDKVRENKYVIAILDYILPEMKGDELAEKLLKIDDDLNLIFISGYTDAEDTISRKGINAYRFFMKPINPETLIDAIKVITSGSPNIHDPVPSALAIV
jgi:two-component system nitrogen regulation response regulator NtrX